MADVEVPSHPHMNQLRESQQELKTAWLHLEEERAQLEHEITQHRDKMHARAHDVH
jgi:hypothetical protein